MSAAPMLNEFIAWWTEQMSGFIPRRWRSATTPANALVFDIDPASRAVMVSERRRQHETERLRIDGSGADAEPLRRLARTRAAGTIVFRPAPASLLERDVSLPLAAGADLARALTYEMDRFTPFRAEQVYWTHRVLSRNAPAGSLRVRLSLVQRDALRGLPELLLRETKAPQLIEIPGRDFGLRTIWIAGAGDGGGIWGIAARVAGWGTLALAVAVAVAPFARQSVARSDMAARIAGLRPKVEQVEALRARIAGASAGSGAIAAEKAQNPDPLKVLSVLTALTPDGTFLTSLTLQGRALTLEGESASAPKLISILSGNPLFKDPSFTAPVTRAQHGKDIFALRTTIIAAPPSPPSRGR